ncbi:hypothetical protein [Desulfofarcimen acetoxidans]|nr:hypothetical protein [Desulfofarcimen acetoxidans]
MPQETGAKNAFSQSYFSSFFALKPLHIVVDLPYLPSKPQFVIIIIVSTCLEWSIMMPVKPGTALAALNPFYLELELFIERIGYNARNHEQNQVDTDSRQQKHSLMCGKMQEDVLQISI